MGLRTEMEKIVEEFDVDTSTLLSVISDRGLPGDEAAVFAELRLISEKLHNALHHLSLDNAVSEITREKIPDAMDGLDYVIEKTREAADKTLDLVEDSMPLASNLASRRISAPTMGIISPAGIGR